MKVQIETRRAMVAWIVWSLLAGWGLADLLGRLPDAWEVVAIGVLALAAIPWAVREHRWAGRQRKAFEEDMAELQRIAESAPPTTGLGRGS